MQNRAKCVHVRKCAQIWNMYAYVWAYICISEAYMQICIYSHMGVTRLFMTKGPAAEPTRQTETLLEHVGDNHTNVFLGNLQCSLTQLKQLLHILQYKSLGTLFAKPASMLLCPHRCELRTAHVANQPGPRQTLVTNSIFFIQSAFTHYPLKC